MEAMNWATIGGIIVDLVIISIIVSNAFWGYRRGLTSVIFKILASIVAFIIVLIVYKPVAAFVIENTKLDETLIAAIESSLSGISFVEGTVIKFEHPLISDSIIELMNSFVNDALQKAETNAIGYVSMQLAYFMIRIGTLILLYGIVRFFLLFIKFAAELIANLPIIRIVNKSGGLIYGVLKGFIIAYLVLAIFSLISPFISEFGIISAIEDSHLGSSMYNNNIILNIFM